MWYSLQEHQVLELVQKSRKKLGLRNAISTVENTPDYKLMTDTKRPFLHCFACFPHPEQHDINMHFMVFSNPTLLGLLLGLVDIIVDATFTPYTPSPFLQCLIFMVLNNQTSLFVSVIYALIIFG